MTAFILKSAIVMALLLAVYYLFLEREKMHRFNRFYLLGSLAISLALPLISIPVYVTVIQQVPEQVSVITAMPDVVALQAKALKEDIDYVSCLLVAAYAFITLVLAIRFGFNIARFYRFKRRNTAIHYKGATLVLLDEAVLPHTFLNTIYLNKAEYDNRHIEPELFTHELTHVRQRHTLDILFIELLKTVLWFNPLLYFYKRAIQLNHEFLADDTTVNHHLNITIYQQMLLEKATPALHYALASSINFSITKKRFLMMTKTTSKTKTLLLKLAVLPVVACVVYAISTKTVAQQPPVKRENIKVEKKRADTTTNTDVPDKAEYFKGVRFMEYDRAEVLKTKVKYGTVIFNKVYEDMTTDEKQRFDMFMYVPKPFVKHSPTVTELKDFQNNKKYAIWIDGNNVPNTALAKYKHQEIAYFSGSVILKNARTKKHPQPFQYWFYTHKYFDAQKMGEVTQRHYGGDTIQVWTENDDVKQ